MENKLQRGARDSSGVVLGALLILAGLLYLVAQLAPVDLAQNAWPLYVIVPGLALIVVSVTIRGLEGFAVVGSMVLVTGLILAVQNASGAWASWSYAWALVVPGAVGLGIAIMGAQRREKARVQRGLWMFATGVTLTTIFALFFEGLLHVSGFTFGPFAGVLLPLFLIAMGFALLAASALSRTSRT
jgi:cytochrome c oxidase subunit IV